MSEAFERERQNNARLEELSSKVSALRGVTIDIYDSARAHEVIDSTVCRPLFMDWDSSLIHCIPW
jgi:blocked early in transport 1